MRWRERQRTKYREQLAASVAAYITQCDDALRAELVRSNGQWPDSLTIPLWPGQIERLALVHWLDELTIKSGKRIRIDFEPSLSTSDMIGPAARLH